MRNLNSRLFRFPFTIFLLLVAGAVVQGQAGNGPAQKVAVPLTGKYEGTAKGPNGDVQMTLDLVDESGKFSGSVTTAHGTYRVVSGQLVDGLLTLDAANNDSKGTFTLQLKDDQLVGEFAADNAKGHCEFKRVVADDLSGDWDAAADAQGQAFPFSLTLKVVGEKVTGTSSSQLGDFTLSLGTWKEGKLTFVLESGNGQIAMSAGLQDGKLVGDYDYAGQFSGKWVATKKK